MGQVWFGTRDHPQWITAPVVDVVAGKQGFSASANFINGGAWGRRSKASAKKFSMTWNMRHRAEIQVITDYADGVYGDGFIYYVNPFAMDRNLLPAYWAAPFINAYDGPAIVDEVRPELINTGSSINGYPLESAQYTITSSSKVPSIYIPIPPGYTAHVGAHGQVISGNASVTLMSHATPAGGPVVNLTLLGKTGALTNATVSGDTYRGLTISMASTSSGVIRLDGLIVQVRQNGAVSPSGAFISGQGQSGMIFVNQPVINEYSAALDRVSATVDLVETEAWQWR